LLSGTFITEETKQTNKRENFWREREKGEYL